MADNKYTARYNPIHDDWEIVAPDGRTAPVGDEAFAEAGLYLIAEGKIDPEELSWVPAPTVAQ